MIINIQKKKPPPKVTQSYVFPKIETLGTSINIPVNGHFRQFSSELLNLTGISRWHHFL